MNFDHHIETLRSFWCLHSSCLLLKKMSEALLFCDSARLYKSVCIMEAITSFWWMALLHPDLTSPVWSFGKRSLWGHHYSIDMEKEACEDTITPLIWKKKSVRTPLVRWQGTEEHCASDCIPETVLAGSMCCCSSVEEEYWQRWRSHWKVTVLSAML